MPHVLDHQRSLINGCDVHLLPASSHNGVETWCYQTNHKSSAWAPEFIRVTRSCQLCTGDVC